MKTRRYLCAVVMLCAIGGISCNAGRSHTPTSPNIAGGIVGVQISAPKPVTPAAGAALLVGAAVVLTVENASTTGVRPLSYSFEVATDPGFALPTFSASGVSQGGNGRTSVNVSTGLVAGRVYHWRSRAADGANTGPFSEARQFAFVEPVVIAAPQPLEPIGGVRVPTRQPTLRTRNAVRTGPAGSILYDFAVSTTDAFAETLTITQAEQESSTAVAVTAVLDQDRRYYWRVRARDGSVTGPWSQPQAFLTPLPAVPPPATPPPAAGTGFPSTEEGTAMVAFVIADLKTRGISIQGDCGAFEVTKRVAWNFRERGAGLERKTAGRRCEDASIDIVLWNDGRSIDMLVGAGVDNGPTWQVFPPYSGWQQFWFAPYNPDGRTATGDWHSTAGAFPLVRLAVR